MTLASPTRRGALVLGASAALAGPAASATTRTPASLDALLTGGPLRDRIAPGAQMAVWRGGRPLYARGYGWADLETQTPVTPQSVFRIGSLTKQFTAAALLLLAEDGVLSLDDPLARFMPEFPRAADLPLRRMMNHTAGLANYTAVPRLTPIGQAARLDYDDAALIAAMQEAKPLQRFEPGTAWAYSNTAYVLLGVVVTRAAKAPYSDVFRQRLFGPAGLTSTAVDVAAEIAPGRAQGYSRDAKATLGFVNAPYISMTFPGAAGSMRSTADDLCRWHAALLEGRILKPASVEAMLMPARLASGALPTAVTRPGAPPQPVSYGLGIGTGEAQGRRYVTHDGGINGFVSTLRTFLDDRTTVAGLFNCDDPGAPGRIDRIRDAALA